MIQTIRTPADRYSTILTSSSTAKSFGETTSTARSGASLTWPSGALSPGNRPFTTTEASGFRSSAGSAVNEFELFPLRHPEQIVGVHQHGRRVRGHWTASLDTNRVYQHLTRIS